MDSRFRGNDGLKTAVSACGLSSLAVNLSHTLFRPENPVFCAVNVRMGRHLMQHPPHLEGRLGVFAIRRGGIDAGHGEIDGVQHARRIAIQQGHTQAALTGRADGLPAEPIDEPLPGFDVHQSRLDTAGSASWRCGGACIIAVWRAADLLVGRSISQDSR